MLATGNDEVYYWKSVVTKITSSSFILQELETGIDEVFKEGSNVFCCVADNAKNMQATLNQLNSKIPSIIPVGWSAHSLNLIMNDVFLKIESARKKNRLSSRMSGEREIIISSLLILVTGDQTWEGKEES